MQQDPVPAPAAAAAKSVADLLKLAQQARRSGDRANALLALEQALLLHAAHAGARLARADLLRELDRIQEADEAYRLLLADQPGMPQAQLGLGRCARSRGELATALAYFEAALAVEPDDHRIRLEIAAARRDLGEFEAARSATATLLERDAGNVEAWISLGRTERSAGNPQAALDAFTHAYALAPQRHPLLLELASEEQALGRYEDAERHLLKAAEIEELAGQALVRLAEFARTGLRYIEALAFAQRAVKSQPGWIGTYLAAAQALYDLGGREDALRTLEATARHFGKQPELVAKHAALLRLAGRLAEALALVQAAIDQAPRHFGLWRERFRIESARGDRAAIQACLEAIPATSLRERAFVQQARGLAAEASCRYQTALSHYRKALALNGADPLTHECLVRLSLLGCDIPAARQHLATAAGIRTAERRRRGLVTSAAQSHLGRFVAEYRLGADALIELAGLTACPSAERVPALLSLVRRQPDYTPAAMALLIALRQTGQFARAASLASPASLSRIPARIVQFWDQPTPPAEVREYMQSWKEHHPQHAHQIFDDASAQRFLSERCAPEVLRAYQRAREPAMKADLFRLAWLSVEGGYYADADDRCLSPISEFVPAGTEFVAWQGGNFGAMQNNFLGASAQHPIIVAALQLGAEAVNRGDKDLVWLSTGPGLLTRAFARTLAESPLTPAAWLERIAVLDQQAISRGVAMHCFVSYKNTDRHWARSSFRHQVASPPTPDASAVNRGESL